MTGADEEGALRIEQSPARKALRLVLARALKIMGWIMLLGFVYWCLSGLGSDKQTAVARYRIDIADLSEGQARHFSVGKQPLIVVHRSQTQIDSLSGAWLNDAGSWQNNEPAGLDPSHRGTQPEWIVVEALGTELNCPVEAKAAGGEFQGRPWPGGFADKCRDQRYDWAGRVYAGQGAKRNLRALHYQRVGASGLAIRLR